MDLLGENVKMFIGVRGFIRLVYLRIYWKKN